MADSYDVIVIGAGPGGYVCALRAAQLGLKTACVDAWTGADGRASPGGTCLNVGCIPSKALLESSENVERAARKFAAHGVIVDGVRVDLARMLARKDGIVRQLTGGVAKLFQRKGVQFVHGSARLGARGRDAWRVTVRGPDDAESALDAAHVVIATGSAPAALPQAPTDGRRIVDSSGALAFDAVPERLGILGAGIIGLELGSVWRRLGSRVTLLKPRPGFLPNVDDQVAREALRLFSAQGLDIRAGAELNDMKSGKNEVTVTYTREGKRETARFDRLIVAAGRAPFTEGLGADAAGLKRDARGFIEVDEHCRTNLANVYAIGDVVRGPMLAHKASEEGVMVAERIAGQATRVNLATVPWVIYTSPEIAWVGATEQDLKRAGRAYRRGMFPFAASGRAHALGETEGFVKTLADARGGRLLGIHIIGPFASELVAEAVVALEYGASSEDLARIVHAHPTLSEAVHEAALSAEGRTLNL